MLAAVLLLALAAGPDAGVPWPSVGASAVLTPGTGGGSSSQSLRLLSPGQVAVSPEMCTAAGQLGLLSGSYACLSGDGTQDSSTGYTLSAVGSPTTQTMEWAPNGSNSADVSRQRWTTSDSYQSASLSAPTGDFSVCHVGPVDAPLSAVTLVSGPGYSLSITSAGVATFTSGGSSVSSASGAVVGGADHLICGTRAGTAGVVYVGATGVLGTVAAPSGSAVLKVGAFAGGTRGAFFTSKVLSATDVQRLQAALVPVPQTATGALISNSRNSASWVTTSGGALVALPPGRTGVVGPPGETGVVGGVVSSPARTNLLQWSEDLSSTAWASSGSLTVATNTTAAPDGSLTADTLTSPGGAVAYTRQSVTASSASYTVSAWAKAGTSTAGVLRMFDGTAGTQLCVTSSALTSSWQRLTCSASVVSGHSVWLQVLPTGLTSNAGTSVWFGAQLEAGSSASPYCRSEGTSATCAGDVITVPTPGWLSTKEGCAAISITPTWTGANPSPASTWFLGSGVANGVLGYDYTGGTQFLATDGTHSPFIEAGWTAGVRARFITRWSASAGTLSVEKVGGAKNSASGFTGFVAWPSSLYIGAKNDGTQQPLGSIVDSLTLGTSPSGCN